MSFDLFMLSLVNRAKVVSIYLFFFFRFYQKIFYQIPAFFSHFSCACQTRKSIFFSSFSRSHATNFIFPPSSVQLMPSVMSLIVARFFVCWQNLSLHRSNVSRVHKRQSTLNWIANAQFPLLLLLFISVS